MTGDRLARLLLVVLVGFIVLYAAAAVLIPVVP